MIASSSDLCRWATGSDLRLCRDYRLRLKARRGTAMGVFENACFTFPQLREIVDLGKARIWAGLRPVTPTGTPLIGQTRIPGLWVNAGHGHLGWTLACGSGRVLADLMCGRTPRSHSPGPECRRFYLTRPVGGAAPAALARLGPRPHGAPSSRAAASRLRPAWTRRPAMLRNTESEMRLASW